MPRTEYADPAAEKVYQDIAKNSSKPAFESTMAIGDYKMPRAGKTTDYMTDEDKAYNKVK